MKPTLPKETFAKNALVYKVLANPKRLEILNLIKRKEISVEELLKATKLPKANLSQHLALMRHNKLVTPRRRGLNILYSIVDPRIVDSCATLYDLRRKGIID